MRAFRLFAWFVLGLVLGGWSVASFAVTFNSGAGSGSVMQRSADGLLSGLNLPGSSINPPSGVTVSTSSSGLTVSESGGWELLDPTGKKVSVPGKQSLTLDASRLSKLAGSMANLLKGGVQGAIVNYLVQEGISLVSNEWQRASTSPDHPIYKYYIDVNTQFDDPQAYTDAYCGGMGWGTGTNLIARTGGQYSFECAGYPGYTRYTTGGYFCPGSTNALTAAQAANTTCAVTTTYSPATEADLQNALDNRTKANDAALKDYYDALLANSQRVKVQDLAMDPSTKYSATGTPTQGQPTTTSTTNPDGSTTTRTETPTYNVDSKGDTYDTNQVNPTNTITTTDKTTNPDGTTKDTTTTTETKPQEDYSFTDKDLPPVPDLYTPKYPDGLAGVWNENIGTIKSSSLFSFVNMLSSGAPSSGSCPSWTLSLSGIGKLGSYTLQPPCIVWPFARWALLITALFVSRRLVFGG